MESRERFMKLLSSSNGVSLPSLQQLAQHSSFSSLSPNSTASSSALAAETSSGSSSSLRTLPTNSSGIHSIDLLIANASSELPSSSSSSGQEINSSFKFTSPTKFISNVKGSLSSRVEREAKNTIGEEEEEEEDE
jgi:hypothetical protein